MVPTVVVPTTAVLATALPTATGSKNDLVRDVPVGAVTVIVQS